MNLKKEACIRNIVLITIFLMVNLVCSIFVYAEATPMVEFSQESYNANSLDGKVEVEIVRTGENLGSVSTVFLKIQSSTLKIENNEYDVTNEDNKELEIQDLKHRNGDWIGKKAKLIFQPNEEKKVISIRISKEIDTSTSKTINLLFDTINTQNITIGKKNSSSIGIMRIIELKPIQAPNVQVDDDKNVIVGIDDSMEYRIDNNSWLDYSIENNKNPDLSGDKAVYVRFKQNETTKESISAMLVFTENTNNRLSDWAIKEYNYARDNNLVTQKLTKGFKEDITREEFCELIVRLYIVSTGKDIKVVGNNPFQDTDNNDVFKAYSIGVVKGKADKEFAPNDKITRQEIAVMIYRALKLLNPNDNNLITMEYIFFEDENQIEQWAKNEIQFIYKKAIMKGVSDNKIAPLGNTTKEQAILLVKRVFENIKLSKN